MISVSVVQTSPLFLRSNSNLDHIANVLNDVRGGLVVLPELATSGYNFERKAQMKGVALDGTENALFDVCRSWVKKTNGAIVVGFPEKSRGQFFNSALWMTRKSFGVYRKIHLFGREKKFFSPGRAPAPVFTWNGVNVGVMICFDWLFPEVARSLMLRGAQVIAHPSNLVLPYAPAGMKTRSLENHVFTATANRVGRERGLVYIGQSQIVNTKGQLLGRLKNKPATLSARINPREALNKKITAANDIVQDRKPLLYR